MKRVEILVVDSNVMDIKKDYRYIITQVTNFDDAFITFQSFNYDVVAFNKNFENSETMNMIKKLIDVQNRNTQLIVLDENEDSRNTFIQLYKTQEHRVDANFEIQDDVLKTASSCSI